MFDEFVELHGDKLFGDDRAIRVGFCHAGPNEGHGPSVTRKAERFGIARKTFSAVPTRKATARRWQKCEWRRNTNCQSSALIDTPGAYPGIGAEERGQAQVIAENMYEMSRLKTPIICVVIGEGGSGGALGIGVGDRVAVMEHAYYSVISPEGCAGILWKGAEHAEKAATRAEVHLKEPAGHGNRRRCDP